MTTETITFKVGDILHGSWGWEQTNPEFAQVIEVKKASVVLRLIMHDSVEGSSYTHGMADTVVPRPDSFRSEPFLRRISKWGFVRGHNDHYVLSHWSGKPMYRSWYG